MWDPLLTMVNEVGVKAIYRKAALGVVDNDAA